MAVGKPAILVNIAGVTEETPLVVPGKSMNAPMIIGATTRLALIEVGSALSSMVIHNCIIYFLLMPAN